MSEERFEIVETICVTLLGNKDNNGDIGLI